MKGAGGRLLHALPHQAGMLTWACRPCDCMHGHALSHSLRTGRNLRGAPPRSCRPCADAPSPHPVPHSPPPFRSELRAIGWCVCKVVMVPDEVAAIAKEVALLAA